MTMTVLFNKIENWYLALGVFFISLITISCSEKHITDPEISNPNGRNDNWGFVGPGGGGAMFYPTVSPHDPEFAFVSCDMTGSYITRNGGESWRMFNLRGVTRFYAFDPIDPSVISDTINRPDSLPLGLISFSVTVPNNGDSADITIYLSETLPSDAQWYKWNTVNGWQIYPASFGITSAGNTYVELTLTDGGEGDADGLANGVIIDPSGAGIAAVAGDAGGDGGGGGG